MAEMAQKLKYHKRTLPLPIRKKIGALIQHYREAANFSKREVATALDLTPTVAFNWENGSCTPRMENLYSLVELFELDSVFNLLPPEVLV